MEFSVEQKIFEAFPGLRIVSVSAKGLGSRCDRAGIDAALLEGWAFAGREALAYGNAQSHPLVKPWGPAMKAMGAPRKEFPCSIEALLRRAGKGGEPMRINPAVDFYNAVSLQNLVPAGGFDTDTMHTGLKLRFSAEGDTFTAMDDDAAIAVSPGEVSYADGSDIITRHFVWKQSRHAILTDATQNIIFVSEILGDLPAETAENVRLAITRGLDRYFGISGQASDILDMDNRTFMF